MSNSVFQPKDGAGVSISGSTTSARGAVGTVGGGCQIRVAIDVGSGATWCYVKFGGSDVTATSADIPMLPGTVENFSVGYAVTHVAVITDAGTCTVKVIPGEGA